MDLLKQIIPLLVTLSLALLVLASGLRSSRGQFLYVLLRPRLLVRALIAIDIVPLFAAITIIAFFPALSHTSKAAILLMAISPVPPLVPGKALKFGGRAEYVYGLQNAMALLAIATVPLLGALIARLYGSAALFPISVVARNVLLGLVLPLGIGLVLGRWIAPALSQRAAPWVSKLASLLLVIAFVPMIIGSWRQMMALVGDGTVMAIIAIVTTAILVGHFLGDRRVDRPTLAFSSAMRHPGIALALAGTNRADPAVSAGVLLFLLVGLVAMVPYQVAVRISARRAQASGSDHTAETDVGG